MARRFRLALRPAKPKIQDNTTSPLESAVKDIVKLYGNIQSRRPIHIGEFPTPVYARPSLQVLRQAHNEANNAANHSGDETTPPGKQDDL